MIPVTEAFHSFLTGLELKKEEQLEATRQQIELSDKIRSNLRGIREIQLIGSYARKTAIRPLNDIDLLLVLDPQTHGERSTCAPTLLLEDVLRALRQCYPSSVPATRIQKRSVGIEFKSTGIGFDLIPAFELPPQDKDGDKARIYQIPNRSEDNWIQTSPEIHARACVTANDRVGGMLNRLIKDAKHWNQSHRDANGDKPLRSFHLEVMSYEAFKDKPDNERIGLRDLLAFLANRVLKPCPEPARLGPALDAALDKHARERAHTELKEAAKLASDAISHERSGDHAAACKAWRALLGPEYKY
jgi:predicted nucleotidyltransferase